MAEPLEDLLRNIVRTEVEAVVASRPPRKAWTVHEVAVSVGVSDSTVRGWIRDGKLRAFHDGSITRIRPEWVDNLMEATA